MSTDTKYAEGGCMPLGCEPAMDYAWFEKYLKDILALHEERKNKPVLPDSFEDDYMASARTLQGSKMV